MQLTEDILQYIDQHSQEAYELLLELSQIPAPSNHEEQRAEFCCRWLRQQGAEGVYLDDALNVIYPVGCTEENPLVVFMAHSDVVFPDTRPLPLTVKDGKIFCPGVGDDSANVAALLMAAKYIAQHRLSPKDRGLLLVINSGEEGLGNLKGTRRLMETFGSRVTEFVTFDLYANQIVDRAVGSHRYRIEIQAEGGHSYNAFGNRNAIAAMAELIGRLYTIEVPAEGKTTYNVGTIRGGTSVNTIAQQAEMLYEYRSDCRTSLAAMEQQFHGIINEFRTRDYDIRVTVVGNRPCSGDVDESHHRMLKDRAAETVRRHYSFGPHFASGSTDCNVPLSMGIPAICVGCMMGGGAHTREEYVEIDSLRPGLAVVFELVLHHF